MINVRAKGYKEFNKYIEIGNREFKFILVPAN